MKFEFGTPYPIETLPDDLRDTAVPARDKWAIREVLLWNDCQGWWMEGASAYLWGAQLYGHVARFWMPLPPSPMTREQILAERGQVICPVCDWAINPNEGHECRPHRLPPIGQQAPTHLAPCLSTEEQRGSVGESSPKI